MLTELMEEKEASAESLAVYRQQNRVIYPRKREVNIPRDDAGCVEVVGSRLIALTRSKISWRPFWEAFSITS